MLTTLLTTPTAPLDRLALHRLQLDVTSPDESLFTDGHEGLLYILVGTVAVVVDGVSLGVIGGRRTVTEPRVHAVRIPAGAARQVHVTLQGYAADLLWITCEYPRSEGRPMAPAAPYLHYTDTVFHDVGTGCYRRIVAEVPTPPGYSLHCGETLSDGMGGCWSSWPSHAAPDEVPRYAEHEEIFFCVTSGYFLMQESGTYCTGETTNGVRCIANGEALVTPLGSHELVVSPGAVGYYAWFYRSFLKKQYNKYATENIGKVYVK